MSAQRFAVFHRTSVGSTMEDIRPLCDAWLPGEAWPALRADVQLTGRGRSGRRWVSPVGNLYASSAIRPQRPLAEWAQLSFAVALSLYDAVTPHLGGRSLSLKWPNDLLVDGAKVAGLILETYGDWLITGTGVNIVTHPAQAEYAVAKLESETVRAPDAQSVLEAYLQSLESWLSAWEREGFAPVREAWLDRAHPAGTAMRVRRPDGDLTGTFQDLDSSGRLIINAEGRAQAISAATVFLL